MEPRFSRMLLAERKTLRDQPARQIMALSSPAFARQFLTLRHKSFFRDPSGLAKFPVDGAQLSQSRVVIRMYEPEDHFTRSFVIPQIKLKDWAAAQ